MTSARGEASTRAIAAAGAGREGEPVAARPRVHALVLNWQGEADTIACVESLLAQRDVDVEILLIDNASPDGSGDRLHARYPTLAFLPTAANLGYAGANNLGIEWARAQDADWVLVINNDAVADPLCVRRLVDAARDGERIAAVAPLIVRHDDPRRVWFAGGRHDRIRAIGVHEHWNEPVDRVLVVEGEGRRWRPCSFVSGCCLLLRRAALDEVGGFRADFFAYVEDLELSARLERRGWRVGWASEARLAHRVPRSARWRRRCRYGCATATAAASCATAIQRPGGSRSRAGSGRRAWYISSGISFSAIVRERRRSCTG
jgi:GT2 family glycosyltransferase